MDDKPFSDEEYGRILDSIVVACVDTVVTYRGRVLLVRRDQDPIKNSWWIFGGRMQKGESLQQAAKRGLHRELNLLIEDEKRFVKVDVFSLNWQVRREPPSNNGCHHMLIAHQIELTDDEKDELSKIVNSSPKYRWQEINSIQKHEILPELYSIIASIKP